MKKLKRLPHKNALHTPASGTTVLINYDAKARVLEVEFQGGRIYHYLNVPPRIWKEYKNIVESGSSSGVYVNTHIKPGYEYTEVAGSGLRVEGQAES